MPRFIISYDLNGSTPTHRAMDEHLAQLFQNRQRVLETVWFVCGSSRDTVYNHVNSILNSDDRLLVMHVDDGAWRNLLGGDNALLKRWETCGP